MGAEHTDWQRSLASALEWWRDAGVDMLVDDAPRDWLARPASTRGSAEQKTEPAAPVVEALPDTLEAFLAWRLSEQNAPEAGWMSPLVPPAGAADAELVVLVDMPEAGDGERLMDGAAGRLLDRMLLAIGKSRETVHLASFAVARPLTGRIPPQQEGRLIELARHHLTLLAPKRLLLVGQCAWRVTEQPPGDGLEDINLFGGKTRVAAIRSPQFLMERPAAKSEAWKHLLWLTRGAE